MPGYPPTDSFKGGVSFLCGATIKPGKMDEFLTLYYEIIEKTRTVPELLCYELFRDLNDPNKLTWTETWTKDDKWLMEFRSKNDYLTQFDEATKPLIEGEKRFEMLERFGGSWAFAQEGAYEKK